MKNKLFPLLIIITLVMVVFGLFGCEDITGLSTTLSLPATTSLTTSTTSSATDTSNISSTAITTSMTTAPLSTTEITSLTVPTTVISTEAFPVVIFQEEFDYTEGTNLGATALWTENKAGNATIVMDDDRTVLKLIETGSEARFDSALTDLGSQRYVLVYGFKQGTGGASFTIELLAGENRVFTVGATRYNRVSYRNPDGSETAVAADTYSIVPGNYYQAVVIFDTETNIYKFYVIDGDDIFEATPSGGLAFMTAEAITSIRIRIVGTSSPASVPESYIDGLLIETTSESEQGKSLFDPEDPIDFEALIDQLYNNLEIPFKDDIREDIYLQSSLYDIPITWSSSNTAYIDNDGTVTRPLSGQVVVTMTATFQKEGIVRSKTFAVTIKAENSDPIFLESDYSLSGFALGHVSIPDVREGDPGYYIVTTPDEFIDAIFAENSSSRGTTAAKIIEIRADLDLGYLEVSDHFRSYSNVKAHSTPLMHPTLKQTGVSMIYIQDRDGSTSKYNEGLMIFSETGHTIRHASFNVKRANNIIIRNLKFTELWEWDEKDKGDYDTNDWDYFTVDTVDGIWFDHIELEKAYDGLIDFKAGSSLENTVVNATMSNMRLVFEQNAFLLAQFEYLEANRASFSYYNGMRQAGMSMEAIMHLASFQKKGFLLGGSELRVGNVFTLTIYNSYIKNLQDRFPRLRGGDVHIFNSVYDATEVYETRNEVRELYPALFAQSIYNRQLTNQALVTTENGAIYMQNSIIKGVSQVIKSNQVGVEYKDENLMTGKYLVEDSLYQLADYIYYGSSDEDGTLFIRANSEPIIPFSWTNISGLSYSNQRLIAVNLLEDYLEELTIGTTSQSFDWLTTTY